MLRGHEKQAITFLEKVDLEKMKLSVADSTITILKNGIGYTSFFYFETEDTLIRFFYEKNQYISSIDVVNEDFSISLYQNEKKPVRNDLIHSIWKQFVEHFNLRIRLLFLNETTPCTWRV